MIIKVLITRLSGFFNGGKNWHEKLEKIIPDKIPFYTILVICINLQMPDSIQNRWTLKAQNLKLIIKYPYSFY